MRRLIAAILILGIFIAACRIDDVDLLQPTMEPEPQLTLIVGEQVREYQLHVPPGEQPSNSWPVVLVIHGLGSNARQMRQLTGFDEVAEREMFIAAYPEGLARAWLDAGLGNTFTDTDMTSLNLMFIDALIDELDRNYGIDRSRVYMTGLSNGGMFSFHAACSLSQQIAAVGLVASASISQSFESCQPEQPVGYIALHGTSDTVVPYEGGPIVPGIDEIGEYQSAPEAARFWAQINGCTTESDRVELPDVNAGDMSFPILESWEPCSSKRSVKLITLEGSGHTWPGHPPRGQRLGATNLDIDATELIWEFFSANPKPAGN